MDTGQNFSIPCGDAASFDIDMDDDWPYSFPTNYELTWSAWEARYAVRISNPLITKTLEDGISVTITPPVVTISLMSDDTAGFPLGNYYHELTMTDPSGNPTTLTTGLMTITLTRLSP